MSRIHPVVFVAVGGALGALSRWLLLDLVADEWAAAATLGINVCGSILVGVLLGRRLASGHGAVALPLLGTGFAGGLTTFSAFAVDLARYIDDGELDQVALRVAATPVLAVVGAGLGYRLGVATWRQRAKSRAQR